MEPLVERHYVNEGERTTRNLEGVITPIPEERYELMVSRLHSMMSTPTGRALGKVVDKTQYYDFHGYDVFMQHGLAQVGTARTADNEKGFGMTRLFANSAEEMHALEEECQLYSKVPS